MALSTGTPWGNIVSQDDIYVEGAPYVYYQDADATPLNNPDGQGFYWGLSGTTAHPVYALGCYEDVRLADGVEVNAVRCDTVGDVDVLQKRTHLELTFTLKSLFPLSTIRAILRGGTVTTTATMERMGIGEIDNAEYFMTYFPKVYDEEALDWVSFTGHRCKFVDAWELAMSFAVPWSIGVTIWLLADSTMPTAQRFATVIRHDPSALP